MDLETIRFLYGYNRWVNERLLDTVDELPAAQLRERFGASFDTIHGTLAHLLGTEIAWLSRWKGVSPKSTLSGDDFASLDEIKTRRAEHLVEMDDFLAALTPEQLEAPVSYVRPTGEHYTVPLWQLMLHVVNHETHHRSELADMLTRSGHAPRPTDLVRYSMVISGQPEP